MSTMIFAILTGLLSIYATYCGALSAEFSNLTRERLQQLAKTNGIKANLKNKEIIRQLELLEITPGGASNQDTSALPVLPVRSDKSYGFPKPKPPPVISYTPGSPPAAQIVAPSAASPSKSYGFPRPRQPSLVDYVPGVPPVRVERVELDALASPPPATAAPVAARVVAEEPVADPPTRIYQNDEYLVVGLRSLATEVLDLTEMYRIGPRRPVAAEAAAISAGGETAAAEVVVIPAVASVAVAAEAVAISAGGETAAAAAEVVVIPAVAAAVAAAAAAEAVPAVAVGTSVLEPESELVSTTSAASVTEVTTVSTTTADLDNTPPKQVGVTAFPEAVVAPSAPLDSSTLVAAATKLASSALSDAFSSALKQGALGQDPVDKFCRATNAGFRSLTIAPVRNYLDTVPARSNMSFLEKLTTPPQSPGVPRPVSLTIAASVPTLLGWYGFYKFSIEEELFQDELKRFGRVSGCGGYGTLLPFVFAFLIGGATSVIPGAKDTVSPACFEAGAAWILISQVNLYIRVNELYAERFPDEVPPLQPWWAVLPPPFDVVVGLRQVHFLARYWADVRGETLPKDKVAEELFPFISSNRFTLRQFVLEPRRWFWFSKDWQDFL